MKNFRSLTHVQSRTLLLILAVVIVSVFALIGVTTETVLTGQTFHAHGQTVMSGEWTAQVSGKRPGQININFIRRSERGNNSSGNTLPIAVFQELSVDPNSTAKADVRFRLVREAGTFNLEGMFANGRGTGVWTFTPNPGFATAMRDRGYGTLSEEDMLRAGMHNLTAKYSDDLKSAGYAKLTFDDLNRASNHDITISYINELKGAGLGDLSMDDLIRASNHDVNAAYVKSVAGMGFEKLPLDQIIRLGNHDIDAGFVSEMRSNFGNELTIEQLISLKNHDVDRAYLGEIKAEGFSAVSPQQAISLKNHDVDGEFIRKAKSQGYPSATIEELIRLSSRGVIK